MGDGGGGGATGGVPREGDGDGGSGTSRLGSSGAAGAVDIVGGGAKLCVVIDSPLPTAELDRHVNDRSERHSVVVVTSARGCEGRCTVDGRPSTVRTAARLEEAVVPLAATEGTGSARDTRLHHRNGELIVSSTLSKCCMQKRREHDPLPPGYGRIWHWRPPATIPEDPWKHTGLKATPYPTGGCLPLPAFSLSLPTQTGRWRPLHLRQGGIPSAPVFHAGEIRVCV